MKYVRTKFHGIAKGNYEIGEILLYLDGEEPITKENIAETVEELMRVGDLVFKENGDIFVIQNQAQIDFYIKYKSVYKLFIEDNNGNYIKVAQKETIEGDLEVV